ncbi:MAG TPA: xanthine dehydrogenase family protein subunit M [Trebonia sp.]|nr:xanthine dehydrogenase family protein subunit M [Trebonia sp.]
MIPGEFDYLRAVSVEHALQLLVDHGEDAKLMAGGHSLLPLLKFRMARPEVVIDIRSLPELRGVAAEGEVLRLGAATTHRLLERDPLVARMAPLLALAARTIGDPQVRSRGTIGGSIAHADPAADLPAVLLALDATVTVRGPDGHRRIRISEFFVGIWQTTLAADEVIVEISVPAAAGRPISFQKFRQRSQDWAIVGVAAVGGDEPAVTLVNMGQTPVRAIATERALAAGATVAEAARLADEGTIPSSDVRGDAAYRRQLARTLTRRALTDLGLS